MPRKIDRLTLFAVKRICPKPATREQLIAELTPHLTELTVAIAQEVNHLEFFTPEQKAENARTLQETMRNLERLFDHVQSQDPTTPRTR